MEEDTSVGNRRLNYYLEYATGPNTGRRYAIFRIFGPDADAANPHLSFKGKFRHVFANDAATTAGGTLIMPPETPGEGGPWEMELWAEQAISSEEERSYHKIWGTISTTWFYGSRSSVSYHLGGGFTRGPSHFVHAGVPLGPEGSTW